MSSEALLLLFVFLVLPLLKGLIRKARVRREQAEGRSAPSRQAPRQAPRQASPPVPRPAPPAWDEDEDEEEKEDEVVVVARPQAPPPLPPPIPPVRQPLRPPVRRAPVAPVAELVLARQARAARLQRAVTDQRQREDAHRRRPHAGTIRALSRPSGVRAAIVLSTVLGPCRANDPHS